MSEPIFRMPGAARQRTLVLVDCDFCEKPFRKRKEELKRTGHNLCSQACMGKWRSREAGRQQRGGFKVGDDVVRVFGPKRLLGIVNGFSRDGVSMRVIVGSNGAGQKYPMKWWVLLKDVDPVAAQELNEGAGGG